MGSSVQFREIFAAESDAATGVSFARFMELALFHPRAGYYARERERVGRNERADFYTATSLGPVFGELVVAASVKLLGADAPSDFTFVEIGAEPDAGVLKDVAHPFAGYRTITLGQPTALPAKCVVFSNELFDAQPCHRLVRRAGAWRELGVALRNDALIELELPAMSRELADIAASFPAETPEGYLLDLPVRSVALLREIVAPDWRGLFVAFDYGKSWRELTEETPQGTARAYSQHRQHNDLLAQPGEQDLTGHVCWDWLRDTLAGAGFGALAVESQEAFFTRHAGEALAAIMAAEAAGFSARKQAIMHLLHPGQMGQKFQILHGLRK
jgi:SAM-dependent MidA family methyltransferase